MLIMNINFNIYFELSNQLQSLFFDTFDGWNYRDFWWLLEELNFFYEEKKYQKKCESIR